MRSTPAVILGLAVVLVAQATASAQCADGRCTIHHFPALVPAQPSYRWKYRDDTPDEAYLFRGGKQVGGYSFATGFYRPYNGKRYLSPAKCPVRPPFGKQHGGAEQNIFGVQPHRWPRGEKIWAGTTQYTHAQAEKLLGDKLDSIEHQPHLTAVVRDPAARKKLEADVKSAQDAGTFPKDVRLQVYDPNATPSGPILAPFRLDADRRYQETGVAVFGQAPATAADGRAQVYSLYGSPTVDALVKVLRKVDPKYDPNISPLPSLPNLPDLSAEAWVAIVLCALLLVGLLRSRAA